MKELDDWLNTVYDVCSRIATICLAHPSTLLKLNMRDFYKDTYFISDLNCEENNIILVKDKQLKKELYRFCCEHEDRVFQGEKDRLDKKEN